MLPVCTYHRVALEEGCRAHQAATQRTRPVPAPPARAARATPVQVLERGERLELLVERTEDLAAQGFAFKTDARRLKRAEAWRRARLAAGLAALVLALAYLLAAFLCGPRLHC